MEYGLSQSVVSDIIQDKDGYVWLATEDGLNRFDGYDFEIFRHDYLDENSIHENWAIKLLEEPGVGIWVGTASGITFYDSASSQFINYSDSDTALRTRTLALNMDSSKNIWVGTNSGLFYIDPTRSKVKRFTSNVGAKIESSIDTIAENTDYIFAGGTDCIFRINKESKEIYDLCLDEQLEPLRKKKIIVLLFHNNKLWIGTTDGLFSYNFADKQLTELRNKKDNLNSLSDDYIQDLLFDSNNLLWIATTEGVNAYSEEDNKFTRYQRKIYAEDGLSANDALCLYIDSNGLLWVGTYTGGFNILDPNQERFDHILTHSDVVDLGKNNTIHGIEKDRNDNLWIASFGAGLLKYNLLSAKISRPLNDINFDYDKYVYALLVDRLEHLWIASIDGLYLYDLKTDKVIETAFFVDDKPIETISGINRIYEDLNGTVWLGRSSGLLKVYSIQINNNRIEIRTRDLTNEFPSSFNRYNPDISSIIHSSDDTYWFGGTAGLVHYKPNINEWVHYQYSKGNHQSLSNDNVQIIFEDSRGFIWIGTADGLNLMVRSSFDSDSVYFDRITTHNGLPNNAIYGLLEDDEGQLWISTNAGIVKYAKTKSDMVRYNAVDGISSNEFNTGAHFTDSDGRLYFGSINGITVIKPKIAVKEKTENRLLFSSVKIGERVVDAKRLNNASNPSITQYQNEMSIDIKMVSIDYAKLGTQRYRYRVNGLGDKWFYLEKQRSIFLAGLDEGRYELEVQSQKVGQDWQVKSQRLSILVETDYWNSRAGYYTIALIILLLFSISLYYVIAYYKRKLKLTDKRLQREAVRLREIRVDNDVLRKEILKKEDAVFNMKKQAEESKKQLDIDKYKDLTTGFMRLEYLHQLQKEMKGNQFPTSLMSSLKNSRMEETRFEETSNSTISTDIEGTQTVTIFELTNISRIERKHGKHAVAELSTKIASIITNNLKPGNQIYVKRNGLFVFCNNTNTVPIIEHQLNVIHLASFIERNVFELLNGLTSTCTVGFTIFNTSSLNKQAQIANLYESNSLDYLLEMHTGLAALLNDNEYSNQNSLSSLLIDSFGGLRFAVSFTDFQSFVKALESSNSAISQETFNMLLDANLISLKQLPIDGQREIL